MNSDNLINLINNVVEKRFKLLTEKELNVIRKELELFRKIKNNKIDINNLNQVIKNENSIIYNSASECLTRIHQIAGVGCLSSCLSSLVIIEAMYEIGLITKTGTNSNVVVGRGHIAPAFYAIRYMKGGMPLSLILSVHDFVPAVVNDKWGFSNTMWSNLGEGLPAAVGMALNRSEMSKGNHIYCFSGDGELNEGISFEAIRVAYEHDIKHFTLIIDDNERGIERLRKPLNPKYLQAFFDEIQFIDGTKQENVKNALSIAFSRGNREAIICKTKKKGKHTYLSTPKGLTTCVTVARVIEELKKKKVVHTITADMAGRFGFKENNQYLNVGLSEQFAIAMTTLLPKNEIKVVLTDDKFLLNSIFSIQSTILNTRNLHIVAARKNDVWGGPNSAPNIFSAIENIEVYELCDPVDFKILFFDKIKSNENSIYLLYDQKIDDLSVIRNNYKSLNKEIKFKSQNNNEILFVSTESISVKISNLCNFFNASHLRILKRRNFDIRMVQNLLRPYKYIFIFERNLIAGGLGEYMSSFIDSKLFLIGTEKFDVPTSKSNQEILTCIDQKQLIDKVRRFLDV